MKITITTDSYLPRVGGQELTTFRLAKYLRKRGHHVRIFTTEKYSQSGPEEAELEVIRAPHCFDFSAKRRLRRRLEALFTDSDVVHSQYCYRLASLSAPIATRLGRRFLVSLHGLGLFDNPRDAWPRRWSHRRYRRRSLFMADTVIATSVEFAQVASAYTDRKKIQVIPNGVDTDQLLLPPPSDERGPSSNHAQVLALGRLVPTKGIQYLLQAAPGVLRAHPDARFLIGGSGSYEAGLRNLARQLEIEDRVDFLGSVPNHQVSQVLAQATVVVFPSTAESTSLACLEAMAMGRPVVVSRIQGFEELLGKETCGVFVDLFETSDYQREPPERLPPAAVERLSGAIRGLIDDPVRAGHLAKAGQRRALSHFDWNVLVEKILALYRGDRTREV